MFNRLIFKMAWLNVIRRKTRSILVILMIAVSMAVMLSIQSIYDGMTHKLIDSTLRSDCGEISIYAKDYRLEQSLKNSIREHTQITKSLDYDKQIKNYTTRIIQSGLASTARKSSMARLIGIDLEKENIFGEFDKFIIDGYKDFSKSKKGAIIGKNLATSLNLKIKDRIIFSTQDANGDISSISLRVLGIVQTTNMYVDQSAIFIPLSKSQSFSALESNGVSQIAIRLNNTNNTNDVKQNIQKQFQNVEVYSWDELFPILEEMQMYMRIFNNITFSIVMLVVFIGILGVMLVSILERQKEFGILMAIGVKYQTIRNQIITEAIILGLLGYILGVIISLLALTYLINTGLDFSEFAAGLEEFGWGSMVYGIMKFEYFTSTFYAIILASLLSTIIPLYRLKKINAIRVIQGD